MQNLSPQELKSLLDQGQVYLLDVRQAEELEIASIAGAVHIPLNELPARLGELDPQKPVVAACAAKWPAVCWNATVLPRSRI